MSNGLFTYQVLPDLPAKSNWNDPSVQMWAATVNRTVKPIYCFAAAIAPTSVGATSTSDQTFTVPGLSTSMHPNITPPPLADGLGIAYAIVTAADTIVIRFFNLSAGPLTPAAGAYHITATRP